MTRKPEIQLLTRHTPRSVERHVLEMWLYPPQNDVNAPVRKPIRQNL